LTLLTGALLTAALLTGALLAGAFSTFAALTLLLGALLATALLATALLAGELSTLAAAALVLALVLAAAALVLALVLAAAALAAFRLGVHLYFSVRKKNGSFLEGRLKKDTSGNFEFKKKRRRNGEKQDRREQVERAGAQSLEHRSGGPKTFP
jgi:O-antigen ligase